LPTAPGFAASAAFVETARPFAVRGFAVEPSGAELFVAIDDALWQVDRQGARTLLRQLPTGHTIGLVAPSPAVAFLFYSDFQANLLWRRDLAHGGESAVPLMANAFDLVVAPTGELLVSANPTWPAPGAASGIWWVDPTGAGNHRELIRLSGPSGPLAIDAAGDLYHATQSDRFPTPPGSVRVLRFGAASWRDALRTGQRLTAADATVVVGGLDGAYGLAVDDRGNLYVSSPNDGVVHRVLTRESRLDPDPLVAPRSGHGSLQLAFVEHGPATFDPFQPRDAGALFVLTADWASRVEVHELRPARPRLRAPGGPVAGPGTIRLELSGLPARQPAWLLLNNLPLVPERPVVTLSGVPAWFGLDLTVPPIAGSTATGAGGDATFDLPYPGGLRWQLALQGAGVTGPAAGLVLLVSTDPITVTLLP
jgi:hypothetical protein